MRTPTRGLPLALIVGGAIALVVVLAVMFFPRARVALATCHGGTGPARSGARYVLTLRADGSTVVSTVDFDGRLWRAVDDRVARDGLVPPSATELGGAVTLVNNEEATFSSPAAYATLLPLTPADGCGALPIARAGHELPLTP